MRGRLLKVISGSEVDDVAALAAEIESEKRKAVDALSEIERIEAEQRTAESFEAARALDEAIARARWQVEHADERIPQLESRLKAAQADRQREAIARHQAILRARYPKFRAALLEAVEQQAEVIREREAAIAEIGEHVATIHLPHIVYAGFLFADLFGLWTAEQDRVFADPPPKPAAAPRPAPVAPAKPAEPEYGWGWTRKRNAPTAEPEPAPRPKQRDPRRDPAPANAGELQVEVLRSGVELSDGTRLVAGDVVTLPAAEAERMVRGGAAEFFTGEAK